MIDVISNNVKPEKKLVLISIEKLILTSFLPFFLYFAVKSSKLIRDDPNSWMVVQRRRRLTC